MPTNNKKVKKQATKGFFKTIKLSDGRTVMVSEYVKARHADLVEFGYTTLTVKEVEEQLDKLLNKVKPSVIGLLMKFDLDEELLK